MTFLNELRDKNQLVMPGWGDALPESSGSFAKDNAGRSRALVAALWECPIKQHTPSRDREVRISDFDSTLITDMDLILEQNGVPHE